jgi:hypothetical protein
MRYDIWQVGDTEDGPLAVADDATHAARIIGHAVAADQDTAEGSLYFAPHGRG